MSGKIFERPGLLAAVDSLRKGDTLIVAKRDRLSRDVFMSCWLDKEAKKDYWNIISCAGEGTENDDPASILMRRITDVFAEYERLIIGFRTKSALKALKVRAGGQSVNGKAPYGWKWVGEPKHMKLVAAPEEQSKIREIIDGRFGCGQPILEISKQLDIPRHIVRSVIDKHRKEVKT